MTARLACYLAPARPPSPHEAGDLYLWWFRHLQEERKEVFSHLEKLHTQLLEQFRVVSETASQAQELKRHEPRVALQTAHSQGDSGYLPPTKDDCGSLTNFPNGEISLAAGARPLAKELLKVSLTGVGHEVQNLLDKGADPNTKFEDFEFSGNRFLAGTPLSIAVLRDNEEVVSTLLRNRADVDSEYSFIAGKSKVELTLPASHAAIKSASLDMLKLLFKFEADVNSKTNLGGNLLWQASYNGHAVVADLLLRSRANLEEPAQSQDDLTQWYTPLHAAALYGRKGVVNKLLDWQADVFGQNDLGNPPIVDAICKGHGDVVRKLVASGASLYTVFPVSQRPSMLSEGTWEFRPMDLLFAYGNSVVIANAALGLKSARGDVMDALEIRDLVRFLRTPGAAPIHILDAIMRQYAVRYWNSAGDRQQATAAVINAAKDFRAALGPHSGVLKTLFKKGSPAPQEVLTFLSELAPEPLPKPERVPSRRSNCVPGVFHMCHVSGITEAADVLQALLDCPLSNIFENSSARVILHIQWMKHKRTMKAYTAFQAIYLMIFGAISLCLEKQQYYSKLKYMTWSGLFLGSIELLFKVAQLSGYLVNGHNHKLGVGFWVDTMVPLTNVVLFVLILLRTSRTVHFNVFLGVCAYFRWVKMFYCFRGIRRVGMHVLPITFALQSAGPFIGVLSLYMAAFIHAYYSLNLLPLWDSFMMVFRMTLLDIDFDRLEGASVPLLEDEQLKYDPTPKSEYHYIVYMFACIATFVMGISLMNIFIAVLSNCYDKASASADSELWRARAGLVRDAMEVSGGLSLIVQLLHSNVKRLRRRVGCARRKSTHRDQLGNEFSYLWYFTPQEDLSCD